MEGAKPSTMGQADLVSLEQAHMIASTQEHAGTGRLSVCSLSSSSPRGSVHRFSPRPSQMSNRDFENNALAVEPESWCSLSHSDPIAMAQSVKAITRHAEATADTYIHFDDDSVNEVWSVMEQAYEESNHSKEQTCKLPL